MSSDKPTCSGRLPTAFKPSQIIAFHGGCTRIAEEFCGEIEFWTNQFKTHSHLRYALFTEAAYPFAVRLLALFQAGKEAWLPGNNRPGTAEQLQREGCRLVGDWGDNATTDSVILPQITDPTRIELAPLDSSQIQIVLYTSGSTGEPKAISKRLCQLEMEVACLEKLWGNCLDNAHILSTVSHQHIYGLLFRVLWPLAAGRCFHSDIYLDPDILANNVTNSELACWIASPAQLKRLDTSSDWQHLSGLAAIFSSGGILPESARVLIRQQTGQEVIEIYGSTETGGIAWKTEGKAWTLFPEMALEQKHGNWLLRSPYLGTDEPYPLPDSLSLLGNKQFLLSGRTDRIVKIEEKRLSLAELEQRLADSPWVQDSFAIKISRQRDLVGVAVQLNSNGLQQLTQQGRKKLIAQLKTYLAQWFERVVLPRRWLLVNAIPMTAQAKIDTALLAGLLDSDKRKFPTVTSLDLSANVVALDLVVPLAHELCYFQDHFVGYPILPGVVQLAWVEYFGKMFFAVGDANLPFSHMETIKFVKIIPPGQQLHLRLHWLSTTGELHFNFGWGDITFSSGKMFYKAV